MNRWARENCFVIVDLPVTRRVQPMLAKLACEIPDGDDRLFEPKMGRLEMHHLERRRRHRVDRLAAETPAAFVAFDVLALDDRSLLLGVFGAECSSPTTQPSERPEASLPVARPVARPGISLRSAAGEGCGGLDRNQDRFRNRDRRGRCSAGLVEDRDQHWVALHDASRGLCIDLEQPFAGHHDREAD